MNNRITCYLSPKAEGRKIDGKGGRGVFALSPIQKDELIAIWGGDVITGEKISDLPFKKRRLILQVEDNHFLLSSKEGPADWVNHSCEPNSGLSGQIVLVAMRKISKGEEICFDYAMSDSSAFDEFICSCGSEKCRGVFTRNDWQLPELWKRYEGYFSPYLQRQIDQIKSGLKKQGSR